MSDEHHDQRAHALLGPSAAERWTSCPASVLLADELPDSGSSYADEGTTFHELCEIRARYELVEQDDEQLRVALDTWLQRHPELTDEQINEMRGHAAAYVELLREKLDARPGAQLMLEVVVQTGIPECWGTADAVIIWPGGVEVVDIKYGAGIWVSVHRNPQLRLYAVGALMLALLLADVEVVRYTVWQPRKDNYATEEMLAAELLAWRDDLLPVAAEALVPGARFGPSDEACQWCPVKGRCDAQMEWAIARDFAEETRLMSPERQAEALEMLPAIRAWCSAVEDAALDDVYSKGKVIPGWKVVMSGGVRKVDDQGLAIDLLLAEGYEREQFMKAPAEPTIQGIGVLEKLVGKADFTRVLGPAVSKGEGKPSLAPEDDSRPSVDPDSEAAKEFS